MVSDQTLDYCLSTAPRLDYMYVSKPVLLNGPTTYKHDSQNVFRSLVNSGTTRACVLRTPRPPRRVDSPFYRAERPRATEQIRRTRGRSNEKPELVCKAPSPCGVES